MATQNKFIGLELLLLL